MAKPENRKNIKWSKLDNAAELFPAIAGQTLTNVFRLSIVLQEEINQEILQESLNTVLAKFPGFKVTLKAGFFWYYFEENTKPAPTVNLESDYPCRYINIRKNNGYLFRVTYLGKRINLEIFHVLSDGLGGIHFLLELTYHYLSLVHNLKSEGTLYFGSNTSIDREDSFSKHYRLGKTRRYKKDKALCVKGEKLLPGELGIIQGNLSVSALKNCCKKYDISINEYLISNYIWSIYKETPQNKLPIRVAVPVDLRRFFDSTTTKNFFLMVSAEFSPLYGVDTFEDMIGRVTENFREQITKDKLLEILSYNVQLEQNIVTRATPLFIKNIAVKSIYRGAALANTSTLSNLGKIPVESKFEPYIESLSACLPMSLGQNIKASVCSFKDQLSFTFSSCLAETGIQKSFFRQLAKDGVNVYLESNGVYHEEL